MLPPSTEALRAAFAAVDPACLAVRRRHFGDTIRFHAPGLKRYRTGDYRGHDEREFASISVTGAACALSCEHCATKVLEPMHALPRAAGSLFDLCARAKERGARGVLISGGCDAEGRVPLLPHVPDLVKARRELDLVIRVHPGLPDEATCAGLGEVGIDGAMIDIIGHADTVRDVYHLDKGPDDYDRALTRLEAHGVPTVPHIVLGLHFGRMLGEERALEIVAAHRPKLLVLVILMPLVGTGMQAVTPPPLDEIGAFFAKARLALPSTPVMLGCARPLGPQKLAIDRLAVACGFNGIAYPADGLVAYAHEHGLAPEFVNACCGVTW